MKTVKRIARQFLVAVCVITFVLSIEVNSLSNSDYKSDQNNNTGVGTTELEHENDVILSSGNFQLNLDKQQTAVLKFVDGNMNCSYYEYSKTTLPYYLIQPNNLDKNENLPLIIWLHGSGEINAAPNTFKNISFPQYLLSLNQECPNAYIICPQLAGPYSPGRWNNDKAVQQIDDIIDGFIMTHNVDRSRVYIIGHSLGGQGALYAAEKLDKFAACISLSPYNPGCTLDNLPMPTIAIAGKATLGEDSASVSYTKSISQIIGESHVIFLDSNHGQLPTKSFQLDNDNDSKSDLLSWLFTISTDINNK